MPRNRPRNKLDTKWTVAFVWAVFGKGKSDAKRCGFGYEDDLLIGSSCSLVENVNVQSQSDRPLNGALEFVRNGGIERPNVFHVSEKGESTDFDSDLPPTQGWCSLQYPQPIVFPEKRGHVGLPRLVRLSDAQRNVVELKG